ncbi:MAG: DUF4143 domain-containing protein [Candidatus Erginobacter occultus]|nr:DUF4143 domain-containing protein [Candidatus Erginobacter occultus]
MRDLARISALEALPRLLALAAGQTSCLLNISELAAPFQVTRPTIREYMTLLSRIFLLDVLPPWHSNRIKRLVKTPKLHIGDTGLACALLGLEAEALRRDRELFGRLLESFVYQELRRLAGWREETVSFFHFRDKDKDEVDVVLEIGGRVAGVEVKAASTVREEDFKGLAKLREAAGKKFTAGVVFYDGEAVAPFGRNLYAVPLSALWENY